MARLLNVSIGSGATYSPLVEAPPEVGPTKKQIEIIGIEGKTEVRPFLEESYVNLEGRFRVDHTFLYTPECPVNLLGWDLIRKIKAQLNFSLEKIEMTVPVHQMFLLGEAIERPKAVTNIPRK